MAKPPSEPAPIPTEDEDDYVPSGPPPAPPGQERKHPIDPPPGNESPGHLGNRSGTPGYQGDQSPRNQGDWSQGGAARQEGRGRGEQVDVRADPYEGRVKIGPRIPAVVRKRLKVAAAVRERNEEDIVTEAIEQWLDRNM